MFHKRFSATERLYNGGTKLIIHIREIFRYALRFVTNKWSIKFWTTFPFDLTKTRLKANLQLKDLFQNKLEAGIIIVSLLHIQEYIYTVFKAVYTTNSIL